MAGSMQLVFVLAIGLAVICTGVVSKDCEECSIAKCQKIEESSGKVYGENEKVALSATECPDEQNCCSFKDTLYYVTGEFAPCACPNRADKESDPIKGFEGKEDSERDTDIGEARSWHSFQADPLTKPGEIPGWYEKEGIVKLAREFGHLFNNPNKHFPHLTPTDKDRRIGRIIDVTELVPQSAAEKRGQALIPYDYPALFARGCSVKGCKEEGEIVKLLEWQKDINKNYFNHARVTAIFEAAKDFNRAFSLREKFKGKVDDFHFIMAFALKTAVTDLNKFAKGI